MRFRIDYSQQRTFAFLDLYEVNKKFLFVNELCT